MLSLQELTGLPRDLTRLIIQYFELEWTLFRTRNILKFHPFHNIECHQATYVSPDDKEITLFDTKTKTLLTWRLYNNYEELLRAIPWSEISQPDDIKAYEIAQHFKILGIRENKIYVTEGGYRRVYSLSERKMLQNVAVFNKLMERTSTWSVGSNPTLWYVWQNLSNDPHICSFDGPGSFALRGYRNIMAIAVNETTIYFKTGDRLNIFDRKSRQVTSFVHLNSSDSARMMLNEKYLFIYRENIDKEGMEIKVFDLDGQSVKNISLPGRLIHVSKDYFLMFHKEKGLMEYRTKIFSD